LGEGGSWLPGDEDFQGDAAEDHVLDGAGAEGEEKGEIFRGVGANL